MALMTETQEVLENNRQGEAYEALKEPQNSNGKKFYLESYGCQMNFSDSEIVASILTEQGYEATKNIEESDVVLINTCAIRENAEQRVRKRLEIFNSYKREKPGMLIGVLGCMAERLKQKLMEEEKMVDLVVGPDAYRDLPKLISEADEGNHAVNVFLSREETYADISPVRLDSNGVSAFISIMRGCDNMCSFCVVPFTRGRERSRDPESIAQEAKDLFNRGYREVTLLGQNVDSFLWKDENEENQVNFAELLAKVGSIDPNLRVRFSTSHPRDITPEVVETIRDYDNVCNYIHFPMQAGSTRILYKMKRNHTREWYLNKINMIREMVPDMGLTTDIITGFCSETEEEHQETLSLMDQVKFDMAYMFHYSERPGTPAAKWFKDDVPLDTKKRRLNEVIELQHKHGLESNQQDLDKTFNVLVEGKSKKSTEQLKGRNSQNKMIVFPDHGHQPGEYATVRITDCTSATLLGDVVH